MFGYICYYPTVIKAILIALNILAQTSSESQDPQWQVQDPNQPMEIRTDEDIRFYDFTAPSRVGSDQHNHRNLTLWLDCGSYSSRLEINPFTITKLRFTRITWI